jgi:tryptophanyl-tRNA synthetase
VRAAGTPHAGVVYCVVDLHAMTMPYVPAELHAACRLTAASLIACGIDPSRSVLFRQSAVREHAELAWVLGCTTPLGSLARMTQFKDKSRGKGAAALAGGGGTRADAVPLGLLSYPVLQAADILLYRATHVPVGEDQHQHLELARDVAGAFNRRFADGRPVLPPPATVSLGGPVARVMSLRDGARKMSKSDADDGSRINLTDSADVIADKVRRARTDSVAGFTYDPAGRPDKANLLGIFAAVTGEGVEDVAARYATASAADFKRDLADALVAKVAPIGARIAQLMEGAPPGAVTSVGGSVAGATATVTGAAAGASAAASGSYIDSVLAQGGERAAALAAETMAEVRALTGYR